MSTPTEAVFAALDVARDMGSVDRAIARAGKDGIVEAEKLKLLVVTILGRDAVGARWATEEASYLQQCEHLRVELTNAGHELLEAA